MADSARRRVQPKDGLSPDAQQAVANAIANLRPHAGESEDLVDVIEALGDVAGEGGDSDSIEKALIDVRDARVALAKAEGASSPAGLEADARLKKAEDDLSIEYLRKQPGAWSEPGAREQLETIRKAESGRLAA
jgi:hypothetical protein